MNGYPRAIADPVAALVLMACAATLLAAPIASATPVDAKITVLYDAF